MFLLLQNSAPKLTHLYEMHAILIHHMKGNCGARGGGEGTWRKKITICTEQERSAGPVRGPVCVRQ
jgi:hypothetical protein